MGTGPSSQSLSSRHVSRKHLPSVFITSPEKVLTTLFMSPEWDFSSFQRPLALLVRAGGRVGVFQGPLLPRGHSALRLASASSLGDESPPSLPPPSTPPVSSKCTGCPRGTDGFSLHTCVPASWAGSLRAAFCKQLGWPLGSCSLLGSPGGAVCGLHSVCEMLTVSLLSAVSHQNSLVVEIPPFRNQRITSPVQVSFYVCNGKRKRSQYQHFTYLPANGNALFLTLSTENEPRGHFF